jgi:hypothetical protein
MTAGAWSSTLMIQMIDNPKMTAAMYKLVYDISPAKTDYFKLVDQFLLFIKTMYLSGEIMYASLSEATVIFG